MVDKGKQPLEEGESSRRPYKRTTRMSRRAYIAIWLGGMRAMEEEVHPPAEPIEQPQAQEPREPVEQPQSHGPREPIAQPHAQGLREPTPEERPLLVNVSLRGTTHQVNFSTVHVQVFRPAIELQEEETSRPGEDGLPPVGVPPPDRARVQEEEEEEEDPKEGPFIPDPVEQEPPKELRGPELGVDWDEPLAKPDVEPEEEVPQELNQGEEDFDDDDEPVDAGDRALWGDDGEEEEEIGWGAVSPEPTSTVTTASTV